jgi:hypothetical protein
MAGLEVESSGKEQGGEAEGPIAPMPPMAERRLSAPSSSGLLVSVGEQEKAGGEDGSKDGKRGGAIPPSTVSAATPLSAPPSSSRSPVSVEEQEKEGGEDGSKDGEAEGTIPALTDSAEASVSARPSSSGLLVSVGEQEKAGGEDGLKGGKEPEVHQQELRKVIAMVDLTKEEEAEFTTPSNDRAASMHSRFEEFFHKHPELLTDPLVREMVATHVAFHLKKPEEVSEEEGGW